MELGGALDWVSGSIPALKALAASGGIPHTGSNPVPRLSTFNFGGDQIMDMETVREILELYPYTPMVYNPETGTVHAATALTRADNLKPLL